MKEYGSNIQKLKENSQKIKENKNIQNLNKSYKMLNMSTKMLNKSTEILNKSTQNKFCYNYIDRTAIIYNSLIFDSTLTKVFELVLEYEKPTISEQLYTKGRQKSNIAVLLYPFDNNKKPICVVSFHLNAYMPSKHVGFHKKQLVSLIRKSMTFVEEYLDENKYNLQIIEFEKYGNEITYLETEKKRVGSKYNSSLKVGMKAILNTNALGTGNNLTMNNIFTLKSIASLEFALNLFAIQADNAP